MRHVLFQSMLASVLATAAPAFAQMLHEVHEGAGIPCAACHTEDPPSDPTPTATCVACHGTMIGPPGEDDVRRPDPHRSPHLGPDEVPVCSECHSVHGKSEDSCSVCHRGFGFEME
jgi:hypothetical protein